MFSRSQRYLASGTPIEVPVPSILTEHEHATLLARLDLTITIPQARRIYTLSRRFVAECGGSMTGRSSHSRVRWYRCTTRDADGKKRCQCAGILADRFEAEVWTRVCSVIADPDSIGELADEATRARNELAESQQAQIKAINEKIAEIEERVGQQGAQLLAAGLGVEEVAAILRSGAGQADALRTKRAEIVRLGRQDLATSSLIDHITVTGGDLNQVLDEADASVQAMVLAALGVRVVITGWDTCPTCSGSGLVRAPVRRPEIARPRGSSVQPVPKRAPYPNTAWKGSSHPRCSTPSDIIEPGLTRQPHGRPVLPSRSQSRIRRRHRHGPHQPDKSAPD